LASLAHLRQRSPDQQPDALPTERSEGGSQRYAPLPVAGGGA